jgi:hypothetical protein
VGFSLATGPSALFQFLGVVMANQATNVVQMTKPEGKGSQFEVQAVIDGFPVKINIEGRADDLRAIVDRLKAIGATPPAAAAAGATSAKGEPPTCPVHNSKMRPSRKPGHWFCAMRTEDGDFCEHKA